MSVKNNWLNKQFNQKKVLKKNLVKEHFAQQNFQSITCVKKNLCQKKCWVQKNWGQIKFWVKKYFGQNNTLVKKQAAKKCGSKNFGQNWVKNS